MSFKVTIRGAATGRRAYACAEHGAFELVVDIATSADPRPCPSCGAASERTVDAAALKVPVGALVRGKYATDRHPMAMDTRPIADGMPVQEFKAMRAKQWADHDRSAMRKAGFKL